MEQEDLTVLFNELTFWYFLTWISFLLADYTLQVQYLACRDQKIEEIKKIQFTKKLFSITKLLTHFFPVLRFYAAWKHQKTVWFSDVLGGVEM